MIRTLAEVREDLAKLARPVHPGVLALTDPKAVARWRKELAAWQAAHPDGQARHELLLEEWEAIERAQVRARAASERLRSTRLPRLVAGALLQLQTTNATKCARQWVDSGRRYLVLAGDVGTGKTVAAGAALAWCMERGATGEWSTSTGFAAALGGFSGQAEAERLKHLDVLVIDDFGTEHLSSFAASVFFEVLAARHENGGRTVLTTNLDGKQFRERLGSRLADRVRESVTWVTCAGPSMRGAK